MIVPTNTNMPVQRTHFDCGHCVVSAALFVLGKTQKADPDKVARELKPLDDSLYMLEIIAYLLEKGLRVHHFTEASMQQVSQQTPEKLRKAMSKWNKNDHRLQWSEEQLTNHNAALVEGAKLAQNHPRYSETVRLPTEDDLSQALNGQQVVITAVTRNSDKRTGHGVMCYEWHSWPPDKPLVSIGVYWPERKREHLASYFEADFWRRLWLRKFGMIVVSA